MLTKDTKPKFNIDEKEGIQQKNNCKVRHVIIVNL